MGRHSIPDPDEPTGDEEPEDSQEPQTERFGHAGADEPDYGPGYGEHDYGRTE
jgi:hypothetical protein